jgi:hypothetical protein
MKLCAAGMLLAMAWTAPTAGAAEITKRDRAGDVSGGAQLATAQRAALDIERVTARANAAGLAVDVRLRGDYAGRRSDLELLLGGVVRALGRERSPTRRKRQLRERGELEDFLFGLGRRILFACPILPASSAPNGSGSPTNRMPISSFTVSPPGPGFKAGQTLTFDGAASRDPDGTIGAYVWSDGDPPHPIASGVRLSRWYAAPGTYRITLSVSDKLGGTAFSSKTLFVGGPGTKALRNPDNSMVQVDCPAPGAVTPRSGAVEMAIPSYAADPAPVMPNPCPDATLATAVTRLTGNPAGEIDEWGRLSDRMRIEYRFDHAGPGSGAQNVALDWSTTWKSGEPLSPRERIPRPWPRTRN